MVRSKPICPPLGAIIKIFTPALYPVLEKVPKLADISANRFLLEKILYREHQHTMKKHNHSWSVAGLALPVFAISTSAFSHQSLIFPTD